MDEDELDAIDRGILYHLQEDGRRPITDIADALDVADNTVRNRMQDMEDAGVIRGYTVDVDYSAAGVEHHYVFVCSTRVRDRERFAAEIRSLPGVVEVLTLMTGTHNLYVLGAGQRKDDITELAYAIDELGPTIEREFLVRDHVKQAFSGFEPPQFLDRG